MSFNSLAYVLFLPVTAGIHFLLPKKYRYIWLCIASLFFYLSNDLRFAAGLFAVVLTTYAAAILMSRAGEKAGRVILISCVSLNILLLLLFRSSVLPGGFAPLGLSFYMLQAIGYTVDVQQHRIPAEKNILRYTVFVAFFPAVLSGPIQRGGELLPQLREGRDFDAKEARSGLYLLLWGYLLKIVAANQLGMMVDFAYSDCENMPGATLLWATVLYGIQLYFDFAGYSALAVGSAKILGFSVRDNFRQPYFAASVRDFWKRWHISLSSWLQDYIYIPLGGSRKGRARKYLNLMVTFLVSGFWHGAGANFLVWGGLHGLYQVTADLFAHRRKTPRAEEKARGIVRTICGCLFTFLLVDFAWLFFRAENLNQALLILRRILFSFDLRGMTYYGSYLLGTTKQTFLFMLIAVCVLFAVDFVHEKGISIEAVTAAKVNIVVRWTCYIVLTMLILWVLVDRYGQAASTFIYARF